MSERGLKQMLLIFGIIVSLSLSGVYYVKTSNQLAFIAEAKCCKTCKKGKACRDSCINKKLKCHKSKGCACDAK